MHSLNNLYQLISEEIEQFTYPTHPKELYEPIAYMMTLGGKRLRPLLLLMAYDLYADNPRQALKPALGIEWFHNFTLMHDDIMDQAPLRRGKPTVHEKWSKTSAILSGDAMLIKAYRLISQVETRFLPQILQVFNDMATSVCEGQQIDMTFERREDVGIEDYFKMIRLKTAALLGSALKIGAIIGGSSAEEAELLYTFGEDIGIAFQLQDDILDLYGNPKKFGKQIGRDILSHKKTFLLIKARELAQGKHKAQLDYWLTTQNLKSLEKIKQVRAIYDQLNLRQLAEDSRTHFIESAFRALEHLPVAPHKKVALQDFATQLLVRES